MERMSDKPEKEAVPTGETDPIDEPVADPVDKPVSDLPPEPANDDVEDSPLIA